jgi:hypothetical protein
MGTQPLRQCLTRNIASGERKHEVLLVINRGTKLHAVHDEEDFHRSVRDAFVTVDESVIPD